MSDTIEAVLWDVGGVFLPSPFHHMADAGTEAGLDGAQLVELVFGPYHEDTDHPWHRLERGELTFDQCNEALKAHAAAEGLDVDPMALLLGMGGSGRSMAIVREDVVAAAVDARARGYRAAIVTNNIREFSEGWRSLFDVEAVAEVVVDSCEVGVRKPDPAIFSLALDRLGGIAPDRAVFLDDAPGNVEAARALGIHAILVGADHTEALAELDTLLS